VTKAIVLLSGGLDSTLAAKIVLEQGIELEALNFLTIFCTCTPKRASCLASQNAIKQLGIPLKVFYVSEEYLEIVKHPRYGYGKNLNPCIDCRIFMFKKAGVYMRERKASFLVTGEVLGERPMSQRKEAIKLIERESGLEGLILRPLSAKLLEPSIPEKEGLVDRGKLLAFSGRSRRPQIKLAKHYGINDYPCPSGGCLLTDSGFAIRMRDLMKHSPDFDLNDVKLLKLGRHFRLSEDVKLIIGRNKEENVKLTALAQKEDIIIDAQDLPGPLALIRGKAQPWQIRQAVTLAVSFSKGKDLSEVNVIIRQGSKGEKRTFSVAPSFTKIKYPVITRI
jgi:tRNA U34 2-thiouridine synthase MnmA/TrmU